VTLIAAYDAREPGIHSIDKLGEWLKLHGLDGHAIYRFELHVIDCPLIRVFEYKRSDSGHVLVNEAGTELLRRDPYDVLQKTDPPIQPWGA
jgi:hypothetical protein